MGRARVPWAAGAAAAAAAAAFREKRVLPKETCYFRSGGRIRNSQVLPEKRGSEGRTDLTWVAGGGWCWWW